MTLHFNTTTTKDIETGIAEYMAVFPGIHEVVYVKRETANGRYCYSKKVTCFIKNI